MLDQAGRRRQVLLAWAFLQRNRGEVVPGNDELSHIAMVRAVPPGLRTPIVTRWAHVLHQLMWLSDQGHPDPVKEALQMAPAGPPMSPGPVPTPRSAGSVVQPPPFPSTLPPNQPAPPGPSGQPMPPAQPVPPADGLRTIEELNHEIEHAAEAARQALARGREDLARPLLVRRNTLRQRLARLSRGEDPASAASAPGQASAPEVGPAEPTGAVASAVPPPPAVDSGTDSLQKLMMWRDSKGHDELKDRHLRQIVNSGARSTAEVGAGLPASLKPLATAIAAVLGLAGPDSTDGVPPPGQGPGVRERAPAPSSLPPAPPGPPPPAAAGRPGPVNPQAISWQQPLELADELSRFAAMDFTQPLGEPVPIKTAARPDGTLILRWPAPADPAPVTIYRVVSDEEHVPFSPDMSEVIGVTTETFFTDARPFASAVRHYQVWVNTGGSVDEAVLDQPRLHAKVPVVAKPADVDIREDEGRVIGQWSVLGDVRRVQIFRVPAERAGAGPGNPMYRICADSPNLGGFVDDDAEPGKRYLYQLLVEAEVEGSPQLSLPTVVPLTTAAVLHPVEDLSCTLGDDPDRPRFDLEWTAPGLGRVVIYRTPGGPLAGADADTVDESVLPQMRLRPADRLAHPIVVDGERNSMRDVPWPRGWSRTYFTPVTLIDGRARVGRTTSQVRTGTIHDARVVERVSEQVLTMDWPEGAAAIKVYASPTGQPAQDAVEGAEPIAEISAEAYVRLGGLHFTRPLDTGGCDLHLLPISFAGGHAVLGQPATVRYPGLLKLWYALDVRRGMMGRGPALMTVKIRADRPNPTSPPFALIHNPHRLPLDVNDGDSLLLRPAVDQAYPASPRFRPMSLAPVWSEPGWVADVTGRAGWVRVFVDILPGPDRGTVALLDPPVAQLYLGGR